MEINVKGLAHEWLLLLLYKVSLGATAIFQVADVIYRSQGTFDRL